mgnify:CR=1 FL=1
MIGIVNLDIGNIRSVANAVYQLGFDYKIIDSAQQFNEVSHIILPGVGYFSTAMEHAHNLQLFKPLKEQVEHEQKPLLGICLGMQLLLEHSEEGDTRGFGFIPGNATKFDSNSLRVPHIGWNNILLNQPHPVLSGIPDNTDYYFVHSYFCQTDDKYTLAHTEYGNKYASIIARNNVIGTQFHPEKSQVNGLQILENFCDWDGQC